MNVDLMVQADRLPIPGETLLGNSFEILPGGKGMNQAVCAAKLGASVTMAGCLGNDDYQSFLKDKLLENSINIDHISMNENKNTGIAVVTTSTEDNCIIVIPGANSSVDVNYVSSIKDIILASDMVMLQLEIPKETVYYVIDLCFENGIPIILNPAPADAIDREYIDKVTYFTPNETELDKIFHKPYQVVLEEFPNKIIMSAGKDGAYFHDGEKLVHCKAESVNVVDTTGAGDAFNGALSVATLEGKSLEEAVKFANKIAAFTTTSKGAQGAMPNIKNILQ